MLPSDAPVDEVVQHLRDHGYAIVEDAVDADTLDRVAAEVAPFVDASAAGDDDYDGRHTRRTGALIARSPAARELVMHPLALGVVRGFLDHVTAVQLHLTQVITIGPGETGQQLHRDQMAFDFFPFPADYHVQCNTMWALTDFTAANGGTRIAPGTSTMADEDAALVVAAPAEMPRGSVLFYDGKVVHGGGANTTDAARMGVNITYAVGWVRQEENQYLACPPDVARTLPDDLLRVMGYQEGAFALGYVGDQQDPLTVLRGGRRRKQPIAAVAGTSDVHRRFVDELGHEPQGKDDG